MANDFQKIPKKESVYRSQPKNKIRILPKFRTRIHHWVKVFEELGLGLGFKGFLGFVFFLSGSCVLRSENPLLLCCAGVVAMVANKKRILAETKRLGEELLQSRAYVNNAPLLLSMLAASCSSSASAPTSAIAVASLTEALHCLQAFFVPLIRSGEFSASARKKAAEKLLKGGRVGGEKGTEDGETDRAEAIYRSWVWDRYLEFCSTLVRIVDGHAIVPSFRVLSRTCNQAAD